MWFVDVDAPGVVPPSERVLFEAACHGDEVAFGRLVGPYRGELHAHCYRMLGSVQDAKDALQNALPGAWQVLAAFEGRSSLRSWLYRVATNACLKILERRPKRLLARDYHPARSEARDQWGPPERKRPPGDNDNDKDELMNLPTVVSREEWLAARKALLAEEKAATRARDALNAARRRLPMVRIEKDYVFDTPGGKRSLPELFEGRRQLIVYHFMFDPSWDEGCPICSLVVDNIGHLSHLHARDTSLTLVSRAPLAKIEKYRERMGWAVPWVSSHGSDFNYDFHVTIDPSVAPAEYNFAPMPMEVTGSVEGHGVSVFLRDGSEVFHTYSSYARGGEVLIGTYTYLDLTPLGRQEDWEQPAGRSDGPPMSWVRRHDEYDGQPVGHQSPGSAAGTPR
jgi:predicted dithiol-disulfide oxidoreductase (DUF899 family)